MHAALLAAEDGNPLLTIHALKLNKFVVLAVVVPGGDQDLDNEGYEDEYALNPTDGWLDAHTGDDAEDCEDTHENNDAIIQLILQGFNERRSLNAWLLVLAVPVDRKGKDALG